MSLVTESPTMTQNERDDVSDETRTSKKDGEAQTEATGEEQVLELRQLLPTLLTHRKLQRRSKHSAAFQSQMADIKERTAETDTNLDVIRTTLATDLIKSLDEPSGVNFKRFTSQLRLKPSVQRSFLQFVATLRHS